MSQLKFTVRKMSGFVIQEETKKNGDTGLELLDA